MESIYRLLREFADTWVRPYESSLKTTWYGLAILSYFILSSGFLIASYGRHFSKNSLIPTMNGKVGWMVMEIVSPLTSILFFRTYKSHGFAGSKGQVLMVLWVMHYFNRAVLSVVLSPKMSPTRMDTVLMSAVFNFVNAGWVGYDLGHLNSKPFVFTPRTSLGLVLFLVGWAVNVASDYHLQSVRRRTGSGEYVLPEWGLYKYIVSPNYAGETVEWIGYSLMLERQSGWAFVIWTILNLAPRARSNLAWYKEKFGDKVGNRKSMIPWIY
jgi:3-oxo-5-alpha-steroid 4-dehydrogenase 1